MKRRGLLTALAVAIVALAATQWALGSEARADSSNRPQMFVVVADGDAVRRAGDGTGLVRSFIGLVTALQEDQIFAVISVEDASRVVGPYHASNPDMERVQDDIESLLRSGGVGPGGSFAEAITEAHAVLARERAAAGSAIYVITGGSQGPDFPRQVDRILPFLPRLGNEGWPLHGAVLPGASAEAVEFLDRLATGSGGQVFDLSDAEGFRPLADAILSQGAKGSLAEVGRRELSPNEVLTSVISVAPGTRETSVLFFNESPYGSLRLSNPSGFEASAGDRTASYVVETPHVVIWKLIDPTPGNWKIDARGMEGLISVWGYSSNKYSLVLGGLGLMPLDKPNTLLAYVEEGGEVAVLEDVRLTLSVTTPDGATIVQQMNDVGIEGDAKAGDGYFSTTLPPLPTKGDYEAELELSWAGYNHKISSRAVFEAGPFPSIEVDPAQVDGLKVGERIKVATVFVHIQGSPYPVAADKLTAILASSDGGEGTLELEPKVLYGDGPAWEYEAYLTPDSETLYTQVLRLSLEYAGVEYTDTSDALVLSSLAPSAPVEPAAAAATVAETLARPVSSLPAPPSQPVEEPSPTPWGVLMVGVLLAVGATVVLLLYVLTRPGPHGYLYNDKDEPLVDFAELKRHRLLAILFRGSVRGCELRVPGLEGVVFHFSRKGISIRSGQDQPTVRVNNEPLIGKANIEDRTWIGARGKLYTFMLAPPQAMGAAGADD